MAIKGALELPGDKSISHRALLFSTFTKGRNIIHNISTGEDVESTRICLLESGIKSTKKNNTVEIVGAKLSESINPLNCGNSGTTTRLITGLLSGQQLKATLIGDQSLSSRPMNRIINPLTLMGAEIKSNNLQLPLKISSSILNGIEYEIPIASAQVKSCLILAGLGAISTSQFYEKTPTRNHTEIMLQKMGANLTVNRNNITVHPITQPLNNYEVIVPGDPSTAGFFIGAALVIPNSKLIIKNVLLNPSRIGLINILQKMNAQIHIIRQWNEIGETVGDIQISYSQLNSIDLDKEDIPSMVDELPIFALIASQADGITRVKGAEELRVKESDRIKAICVNMKEIGVNILELKDGFVIEGVSNLRGGHIKTYNDHRIAMTFEIANLISNEKIIIDNPKCIDISYPEFKETLNGISL
jgi:3-phosphoshikimate 1-carboxyvinyltransferase